MSFVQLLGMRASDQPAGRAYTFLADGESDEVPIAYGELDKQARAIAVSLQAAGVLPGDRVLLLYPPGPEYIAGFLGCLYAQVVAVPAYPPDPARLQRTLPRVQSIVADSRATAAMTTSAIVAMAEFVFADTPDLRALRWLATDTVNLADAALWKPHTPSADALAFLQYTSGSTGSPKGVMLSNGNLLHNSRLISEAFDLSTDPRGVIWLPPYHDMGLIGGILQPLYSGFPTVLMSPLSFLQRPLRWLEAISRYKATASGGPNFAFDLCVRKSTDEDRARLDLTSWELAFCGAEPVRADTLQRFSEAFAPCGFKPEAFYPCYGLAESTLIVSGGERSKPPVVRCLSATALEAGTAVDVSRDEPRGRKHVGCGRPLSDLGVLIVSPATRVPQPENVVGEIWVSGPSVAQGYWQRDELSRETFHATTASGGDAKYLRTGDLGFLSDGELFVTGRVKDLIIVRGRNHYPQDLELTAERAHPAIRLGCGAAFAVDIGGQERLIIVLEYERRYRPDRRTMSTPSAADLQRRVSPERRGSDPEIQAFAGEVASAARLQKLRESRSEPPALDPMEVLESVRQAIAEQHQIQAHAIVLIKAGTIAKTSSGKIQRSTCRQAYVDGTLEVIREWAARTSSQATPATGISDFPSHTAELRQRAQQANDEPAQFHIVSDLTHWLITRLSRTLGIDAREIDTRQPITRYGIDSLKSVELLNEIESHLGVVIPLTHILQGPTATELASQLLVAISNGSRGPALEAEPVPPKEFPLSHGQRALWFLDRLAPESTAYSIVRAIRMRGDLDAATLERAFQGIVDRHPALRTTFFSVDGEPWQRIADEREVAFENIDATAWSASELAERLDLEAARPFDLEQGPLLRMSLVRLENEHILLFAIHHIISDLWSLGTIFNEVRLLYASLRRDEHVILSGLPLQYSDFVKWQRATLDGDRANHLWEFWRTQLGGSLPVLDLPTDRARPPLQTFRGDSRSIRIDDKLARRLRGLAQAHDATLFTTLLSAYAILLQRYSGQDDLIIGTPTVGRGRAGLSGIVNYFVNVVPLRLRFSGDDSPLTVLERARRAVFGALDHDELPFALLVERLRPPRDPSRSTVFQAMFVLQQSPFPDAEGLSEFALAEPGATMDFAGIAIESVTLRQRVSQFDITLSIAESGPGLIAAIEFNTDLFDPVTIDRMLTHFARLLQGIADAPSAPVGTLSLAGAEERALFASWNTAGLALATDECAHHLFEAQVARTPGAIALAMDGGVSWTYRQLDERANRLANHLRSERVGPRDLVAISLRRGPEMVVAMLAVFKAGSAYVPLDVDYPQERLAYMLADSGARVLVTETSLQKVFARDGVRCLLVDRLGDVLAESSTSRCVSGVRSDDLAYVIYTSGSTGRPKGVMLQHRGLCNLVRAQTRRFGIRPGDRLLQFASFSFDTSVEEVFAALATGATLCFAPAGTTLVGRDLWNVLADLAITVVTSFTPSALATLPHEPLPKLQTIVCGGEACGPDLVARWAPGRRFFNAYGPTEATVDALVTECWATDVGAPTIGTPIEGVRAYVLDAMDRPAPMGVRGELCLGGVGLARGYLGQPDLTAERFVPDPFSDVPGARMYRTRDLVRIMPDASVQYLGRVDQQVKVRGYRIELGEIEAALRTHPGVRDAVVDVRSGSAGARRLVAYVAVRQPAADFERTLRAFLKIDLPDYMIPEAFVWIDAVPQTPTGKVDRAALPVPASARDGDAGVPVGPRNEIEEGLVAIWSEVLDRKPIGIHDDFFDLGGHSLLAVQVLSRIRAAFGIDLTVRQVFNCPTIAQIAIVLEARLLADLETMSDADAERLLGGS